VRNYFLILPIALLVTYSQIIVKWRVCLVGQGVVSTYPRHIFIFITDPLIVSAYTAALVASFAWLYVVTKLPLTIAFPVYIGITFAMVLLGGWLFLSEPLSTTKFVAVLLILAGIIIGVSADV
jgi:multidrug transporter EmrE-like cation transporter